MAKPDYIYCILLVLGDVNQAQHHCKISNLSCGIQNPPYMPIE